MRILTIIPARSGSKRLPGKNWEKVGGKTLIQRALDCAPVEDGDVVVVSDAPKKCPRFERGAELYVLKEPDGLAGDKTPIRDVVRWAITEWGKNYPVGDRYADAVLLLQPTSPLRTPQDVQRCIEMYETRRDEEAWPDSIVSVVRRKRPDAHNTHFETNGAIYLMSWEQASTVGEIGGDVRFYLMPESRSIDIDTAEDLAEARRLAGDT